VDTERSCVSLYLIAVSDLVDFVNGDALEGGDDKSTQSFQAATIIASFS